MVARNRSSHRHQFHRVDRSGRGRDHRHFGGRSRAHGARRDRAGCETRRHRAAGPRLPGDGAGGRRAARAGHTEAGCDLARLAGWTPAAVICEIMKDDGTMARLPDLDRVRARRTASRSARSPTSSTIAAAPSGWSSGSPSVRSTRAHGAFRLVVYRDKLTDATHLALVRGPLIRPTPRRSCACTSRCR